MKSGNLLGLIFSALLLFASSGSALAGAYEDVLIGITNDDLPLVTRLIDRGIDPNTLDPTGEPLLINAFRKSAWKVAAALIERQDVNVNLRNSVRETPAMLAAYRGRIDLLNKLLERDAEINHPGWTPLHYAAANGFNEIVSLLLEHSAYIDAESPNKTTPIMMAVRGGHISTVKLLLDEGADVTVKNDQGMTIQDIAKLHKQNEIYEGLRLRAKRDAERRLKPWRS